MEIIKRIEPETLIIGDQKNLLRRRNMKRIEPFFKPKSRIILAFFLIPLLSLTAAADKEFPAEVLAAKARIKASMILSHIQFLASPHCRGRDPGDRGMRVADAYITSVFRGIGVSPASKYGNYYQNVDMHRVSLSKDCFLTVKANSFTKKAKLELDFLPVILSGEREVQAAVVFAGYGITAPEHKYDDYQKLDAKGKIVLVMRHEPGENDEKSPFEGRKNSKHGTLLKKILNAQKHGAVGIMVVSDPLNHDDCTPAQCGGTYWPSLYKERYKDEEDYKFMDFEPRMRLANDKFGVYIPVVSIDLNLAEMILGTGQSLKKIQGKMDRNFKPNSFPVKGLQVAFAVSFDLKDVPAHNLVAKIDGSDPQLKDEVVIVGAHYDHEGKDKRGRVYGGADDNASGTAGILEVVRAFKEPDIKPKRTILFILFTAEEKGLLGSRYYTYHPLFPLKKTIAMINLDMIGRNDVDQMTVIGKYENPKLFEIINKINKSTVNFEFNFSAEELIRNSDHFCFLRNNVPAIFFNSGMHDQLHTPEDTIDRIIPEKTEKTAQLVFLSLWKIANLPAGTTLTKGGE